MIFDLSKQEQKQLRAIASSYDKLFIEAVEKANSLAPEERAPKNPTRAEFEQWIASGTDEWRAAREREMTILQEREESLDAFLEKVHDKHFKKIAEKGNDAIVESAYEEIDGAITTAYNFYETQRTTGKDDTGQKIKQFTAFDVRATETGFYLDSTYMLKTLKTSIVKRHLEALKGDLQRTELIESYIAKALSNSPHVSSTEGILGAPVKVSIKQDVEETSIQAKPLDKATVLITRLMNVAFTGERSLERDYNRDINDPTNRYNVGLYSKDCPYKLKVAIDYSAMIGNEIVQLPPLTKLGKHIYNAIVSYWIQGNYTPTFRQIWRATCGNITREIRYGENERQAIQQALLSYKASIAYSTGEIVQMGAGDKKVANIIEEGGVRQLLHYDTDYRKVNGQLTDILLLNPTQRPALLSLAQALNNEYMTDNISFFDVPGIVATEENLDLKEYLFIRIKKMKNPNNPIKQKSINIDTLAADLGMKPFNKKDTKDRVRKSRLVERITKILDNAVSVNFIAGYTANKRKGSTEIISFAIDLYKK